LKIESPTAEKIGLHIPLPNLAKNGLLSFFSYNMDQHGTYPECYDNERLRTEEKLRKFKEINADCYGNHLIMEYFQPKGISKNPEIRIDKFVYLYYDGFGIKKKASDNYRDINTDSTSINLKSGYFGTAKFSCQNDIACSTLWDDMRKAVVYIQFRYVTPDGSSFFSKGTGFLINKSGSGYGLTDNPLIVTCGHLYAPEVAPNTYYDISNNHGAI
jgi:hypothetical protein